MTNEEIITSLAVAIGCLKGVQKVYPSTKDSTDTGMAGCYAAIKELDKKAYKPQPGPELTYTTDCCCGNCDASIFRNDSFCRVCGSQIDWRDE